MKCNATAKSTGKPCQREAMPNGKCWVHGGNSPKGIASGTFKHGRYSKYVPIGLMDTYNELFADPEALAMNHEIALVDTYITQLIESLGDYSSPELWEQLQAQVIEYKKAQKDDKGPLLEYILEQIEAGASYVSKWDTLHKAVEQRRKLVADERKRRIEMEQFVDVQQAMTVVSGLLESVRENVKDRNVLNSIQADFVRLVGSARQQRIDSGEND